MFPRISDLVLASTQQPALGSIDWGVIGLYFLALLGLTWYSVLKNRDTADDYFLAGRNLGWFVVAASIFSSNIGSEHLVGLAGSGCTDGVAMAHYELHAWCLLVLAWVMIPFYTRSMVYTMPEFLEKRFTPAARWVLSTISLVAYVLTKLAVGIFAGGIVFQVLLPELRMNLGGIELDSFWIGSVAVVLMTGLYTVIGGLRAVAYTDTLQTIIFIVGSAMVTVFGLIQLGGWQQLREVCGSEMFNLWKPLVPEGMQGTWAPVKDSHQIAWYFNDKFPWLGMLFCAPIVGLWYWCTDQYIVQRALAAPNERVARRGSIGAAFMKLLPVFVFIIPGMICFALAKTGAAGLTPSAGRARNRIVNNHWTPDSHGRHGLNKKTGRQKGDI
jgi:SSS family solute:Na+ symporter